MLAVGVRDELGRADPDREEGAPGVPQLGRQLSQHHEGVAGGQLQELGVEGGPRRSRVGLGAPPPFDALATPRWLGEWLGGE